MKVNSITLCAVVKNETDNIKRYLGKTFELFDAIKITDTGSNDGTVVLLKSEYGIEASTLEVSSKDHFSILDARNFNIRSAYTEYILVLDADETITEDDVRKIRMAVRENPGADGFFLNWNTYKVNSSPVEDYKLNLFKNDPSIRFVGQRHPYVTVSIRDKGGHAGWLDAEISHFPDPMKQRQKTLNSLAHLYKLIEREPQYVRYHWFLGMALYSIGDRENAVPFLEKCAHSKSARFPVECINSHLLLADFYYERQQENRALDTVKRALTLFENVKDDFEVQVNFRLLPTLEKMKEDIQNDSESLTFYPFGGI